MKQTQLIGHNNNDPEPNSNVKNDNSADVNSKSETNEFRDSAIDSWTTKYETQEKAFGYLHLYAIGESTLSGVDYHLQYEAKITHPASGDNQGLLHDRVKWGGCSSERARELLVEWKLEKMALPLHPKIRGIPTERLQIFGSDIAREYLREQDIKIDTLVDDLNQLSEHNPTDERIKRHREYNKLKSATQGHDAWMEQRIREIENTIRSRLGFSGRYENDIPEPDPEYDHLGIAKLKKKLETARNELEQAQQRKDTLSEELDERKSHWTAQAQKDLL